MVVMDEFEEQLHYLTLHRDIGLEQKSNGLWDISWSGNDYVNAQGLDSIYNACVFSLLTGYNEIGRMGVGLYDGFGNKSYSLLKANKDNLTLHKLRSYFTECLNNIRRVDDVLDLTITEDNNGSLYTYKVFFKVLTITNEIIEGMVDLTDTIYQKPTILEVENNINNTIEDNQITCTLTNKKHEPIPHQIIKIYLNNTLTDRQITDEKGQATFTLNLENITTNNIIIKLESEPTIQHQTSNTDITLQNPQITFTLNINNNGELIYHYDDETPHPNFTLNEKGELLMNYDDNILKFNTIQINEEGYLIMSL